MKLLISALFLSAFSLAQAGSACCAMSPAKPETKTVEAAATSTETTASAETAPKKEACEKSDKKCDDKKACPIGAEKECAEKKDAAKVS